MSQNTCKLLLALSIVLLVVVTLASPHGCAYALLPDSFWLSSLLSILFISAIAAFLSYLNRSIFLVSSDRLTLPLIFVLTSLSDADVLSFSVCHIVAFLTLSAIFFMLRFIAAEEHSGSDYFVWCLLISCSAYLVPQLIWLLIPGFFNALKSTRGRFFHFFLMTAAAVLLPVIYVCSYQFVFSDGIWYDGVLDRASESVHFLLPKEFPAISIFYSLVMGIVILSSVVIVLRKYELIRNTSLRKQSRFIFPYFFFMCVIFISGKVNTGMMMVFAIPWSLLFLYYGELDEYGRGWRHLVLLMIVSTLVFRAHQII